MNQLTPSPVVTTLNAPDRTAHFRELFEEEWELSAYPFASFRRTPAMPFDPDRCPAAWLTPGVVRRSMLRTPTEELTPLVHDLLTHRLGEDTTRVHAPLLDGYVAKIVDTLQRTRDRVACPPHPPALRRS